MQHRFFVIVLIYCLLFKKIITGESFVSLGGQFCVGNCTVGKIVFETCNAIASELAFVLKQPDTPEEWMVITYIFYFIAIFL